MRSYARIFGRDEVLNDDGDVIPSMMTAHICLDITAETFLCFYLLPPILCDSSGTLVCGVP